MKKKSREISLLLFALWLRGKKSDISWRIILKKIHHITLKTRSTQKKIRREKKKEKGELEEQMKAAARRSRRMRENAREPFRRCDGPAGAMPD